VTQHVIGGTNVDTDRRKLAPGSRCDLLVATPGRVCDLMGYPIGGGKAQRIKEAKKTPEQRRADERSVASFRARLATVQVLTLDEADRMVERGFLQQVQRIKDAVRPGHQTLMFSATIPEGMSENRMLRPGFELVDVVGKKLGDQTNTQVVQRAVLAPVEHHMDALTDVVERCVLEFRARNAEAAKRASELAFGCTADELSKRCNFSRATMLALAKWEVVETTGFRIMIFAPCNAYVDYIARALAETTVYEVLSIHGNLSQGKRTRSYDSFLARGNTILVTSDASARGLDFPDVTMVVQLGFNARAEYTHRVGRTGRAGKGGLGVVLLDDKVEASVLQPHSPDSLSDFIPLKSGNVEKWDRSKSLGRPFRVPASSKDTKEAKQVLRSWIGAYAGRWKTLKWQPQAVADMCLRMGVALGLGGDAEALAKIQEKLLTPGGGAAGESGRTITVRCSNRMLVPCRPPRRPHHPYLRAVSALDLAARPAPAPVKPSSSATRAWARREVIWCFPRALATEALSVAAPPAPRAAAASRRSRASPSVPRAARRPARAEERPAPAS